MAGEVPSELFKSEFFPETCGSPGVDPVDDDINASSLQIERLERALRLDPLLNYVDQVVNQPLSTDEGTTDASDDEFHLSRHQKILKDGESNGIFSSLAEKKSDKKRMYNFSKVKKNRRWLKSILLSDSSDSSESDEDAPLTEQEFNDMMRLYKYKCSCHSNYYSDPDNQQYMYYSTGILSRHDRFPEHQKLVTAHKTHKKKKKEERKTKGVKVKKMRKDVLPNGELSLHIPSNISRSELLSRQIPKRPRTEQEMDAIRRKLWIAICKKDIPKATKQRSSARNNAQTNARRLALLCMRKARQAAMVSQKTCRETPSRLRRLNREMLVYWKRQEKMEKEYRKRAEKEAVEQKRLEMEMKEAKRQQRKLNFLITQTELYAHFMSRKLTGEGDIERNQILNRLDENDNGRTPLASFHDDDYDSETMKQTAIKNAQGALAIHEAKTKAFDLEVAIEQNNFLDSKDTNSNFSLANPSISAGDDIPQPEMFQGELKAYQKRGMNWLCNLYETGINGILADEMGLGKTVQSIAFMAHLAEVQGIWGPFLVIAPASTLHNWQQECTRFMPQFKALPYWGNQSDRKTLRKFWNQKQFHSEDATFHILITSYQLVVQDVQYFKRVKWQYMILDEAQAIKSSSSARWKILLSFNCRNRLLLTGTPIQNSMAELWALLHFIMPTLFDSHEEFNEWFSKDIESHVEKQSGISEEQLSRLHMILKPFMLRRIKKDVENELSDKIEILVYCHLTTRQKLLYQALKARISIDDLLRSTIASSSGQLTTNNLMNLVMQFRKVCNHPELFERRETRSPVFFDRGPFFIPKLIYREGLLDRSLTIRSKLVYNTFNIFSPENVHRSLFPRTWEDSSSRSCFSFTRLVDLSPGQLRSLMCAGLVARWLYVFLALKAAYRLYHQSTWRQDHHQRLSSLLLWPSWPSSFPGVERSPVLSNLVFVKPSSRISAHTRHTYHYMEETAWHRRIRAGKVKVRSPTRLTSPTRRVPGSPVKTHPTSPTKTRLGSSGSGGGLHLTSSGHFPPLRPPTNKAPPVVHQNCPTSLPAFTHFLLPKISCPGWDFTSCDRSCAHEQALYRAGGPPPARLCLLYGSPQLYQAQPAARFTSVDIGGLFGARPTHGWSNIKIPDKDEMVTDSGKLYVLDQLLTKLKANAHRVLIYSQMTRMIDILEEFMWHRKHTYKRLDGSSKISSRRDMVDDFQKRSDIFVFLLSTRAGGLGINLTAADTVIFYDSDWNPTVDQQAMDRAHRLGQTKQVTVYRIICKGTIEERILQRAKEKSEIQRMVISGGQFKPDQLKPKEVVSLLLDDDEIERKFRQKQDERNKQEEIYKEKKRKKEKLSEKLPLKRFKDALGAEVSRNFTADSESIGSFDSAVPSPAASYISEVSVGNDYRGLNATPVFADENSSSNDVLVIADDVPIQSEATPPPQRSRKRGRPRTRPIITAPKKRPGRPKKPAREGAAGMASGVPLATVDFSAYGFSSTGLDSRNRLPAKEDSGQNQ